MTDVGIALGLLRSLRGWSRAQLARRADLHASSIGRIEQGRRPHPGSIENIRKAFGLSVSTWQRLLALIADCRNEMSLGSPTPAAGEAQRLEDALSILAPRVLAAFTALPAASIKVLPPPVPTATDRSRANELWKRLRPLRQTDRRDLIAIAEEYFFWALAERLALESEKIALDRAGEALALAAMADRIAEHAPMPSRFRARLRGVTLACLGYARRAAGQLRGADAAFRRSDELWVQGAGGDPAGLLDGSHRLDLKTKGLPGNLVKRGANEVLER